MIQAKLTSKGQITIPIEIRRLLNVKDGDQIAFTISDHGIIMDKLTRPLTIEERFENYNIDRSNKDLTEHMKEIDTGKNIGEEN